ncbi:hypothetical protein [Bradyrhizobium valentinum]|uniref:hypothetical protein n=1 Tax=Bradyrhizobium valentinum TaxID=1518501 RepID=UPI000A3E52D0|nr:hypothetical protein [Bradyrhizobium valentinum]
MLAEVTRQEAPATGAGGDIDAPAIRSRPSCLDAPTLRSAHAMLNCTEVNDQHRNGCTGYTKVCEPARGDGHVIAVTLSRRIDHADLPGLFRVPPVETLESGHMGLQESKIVSVENEQTEIE